jgi:Uma2 family endonuclease
MTLASAAASAEMGFEEYLAAYDGVHAEWVDGRVTVEDGWTVRHARVKRFLTCVLQIWAEEHDGGQTYMAPFTLKLGEAVAREPDVFFLRPENQRRVTETYVDGPADLAIEIASGASHARARGEKWRDYEAAGVGEYWLIDPERCTAEAWRLDASGRYDPVVLGTPPVLRSEALPGMEIPVAWLWRTPTVPLTDVVASWAAGSSRGDTRRRP